MSTTRSSRWLFAKLSDNKIYDMMGTFILFCIAGLIGVIGGMKIQGLLLESKLHSMRTALQYASDKLRDLNIEYDEVNFDDVVFVGDILDEEKLKYNFEMELSYDVACALWSMRLNPLKWDIKSTKVSSEDYVFHPYTSMNGVYEFIHVKSGQNLTSLLNELEEKALIAQFKKLQKFQRDLIDQDNLFDDSIKIAVPQPLSRGIVYNSRHNY